MCTWMLGMPPDGLGNALVDVVEAGDRVGVQGVIGACNRQVCHDQSIGDAAQQIIKHCMQCPPLERTSQRVALASDSNTAIQMKQADCHTCVFSCSQR
jgi:hypothetical protein